MWAPLVTAPGTVLKLVTRIGSGLGIALRDSLSSKLIGLALNLRLGA